MVIALSLKWLTQVWENSPYDGTALLIHLGMADHADDEGNFFMSQVTLGRKARCSVEYIRKIVTRMQADNLLVITKKGSSKGRATEYRLLPIVSQELNSPTLIPELPNSEAQLPNSTPYQPSYTTVIDTTNTTEVVAKEIASRWWNEQVPRPLGKRSWIVLVRVVKAAVEAGYTPERIYLALKSIGSVPSMAQMDRQLRNVQATTARQKRLARGLSLVQENPFEALEQ